MRWDEVRRETYEVDGMCVVSRSLSTRSSNAPDCEKTSARCVAHAPDASGPSPSPTLPSRAAAAPPAAAGASAFPMPHSCRICCSARSLGAHANACSPPAPLACAMHVAYSGCVGVSTSSGWLHTCEGMCEDMCCVNMHTTHACEVRCEGQCERENEQRSSCAPCASIAARQRRAWPPCGFPGDHHRPTPPNRRLPSYCRR
jgi:hypothetical protein